MNGDDIQNLANEIVAKAERDEKAVEIKSVIAQIKGDIMSLVNQKITAITLVEYAEKLRDGKLGESKPTYGGDHVAFYIAEAAEKIMTRCWLEKR